MNVILLIFFAIILNANAEDAPACNSSCIIENNCRCSSVEGPLPIEDTPQLIVLAFSDAAREETYKNIWSQLVEPRKNPDNEFVSATFYINHEYSNYRVVHDLASMGFEIGVHSVTNNASVAYWRTATEELLEHEFGDQRKIISKFANIPEEYIIGTLTPQLQLAGDNSIKAFQNNGFIYDCSWPSKVSLFPYTLDYASIQDCSNGAFCPNSPFPGFWETPINDLISPDDGDVCNTIAACFRDDSHVLSTKEISDWLVGEVMRIKNSNRAPLTLIVEQNLFDNVENSWSGLVSALDILQEDKEIFLVSQARVIEWIRNPVPIKDFKTNPQIVKTGCVIETCNLLNEKGEHRGMGTCVPCPKNYPWLYNPEGK